MQRILVEKYMYGVNARKRMLQVVHRAFWMDTTSVTLPETL